MISFIVILMGKGWESNILIGVELNYISIIFHYHSHLFLFFN